MAQRLLSGCSPVSAIFSCQNILLIDASEINNTFLKIDRTKVKPVAQLVPMAGFSILQQSAILESWIKRW